MSEIQNFLTKEFTFTLSGTLIIIASIISFLGILSALVLSFKLIQKINENNKPRYGFLGKPLYQILALALIIGAGFGSVYIAYQDSDIQDTSANIELDTQLDIKVINQNTTNSDIRFEIIPIINESQWDENQEFDLYVNIAGPEIITKTIVAANKISNPAIFTENLDTGIYNITITIIGDELYTQYEDTFIVN